MLSFAVIVTEKLFIFTLKNAQIRHASTIKWISDMSNETISDERIEQLKALLSPDYGTMAFNMSIIQLDKMSREFSTIKELIDHYQATKELRWRSVDDAPKDGSKFIGLFNDGVFRAWRGAYNMYKPKDGGGYYVADKAYHWNYEATDSIHSGKLLGWMPLPTKGDE